MADRTKQPVPEQKVSPVKLFTNADAKVIILESDYNRHRDLYALFLGHKDMVVNMAATENESVGRMRFNLMRKFVGPTLSLR